jgi:hypothetical protein
MAAEVALWNDPAGQKGKYPFPETQRKVDLLKVAYRICTQGLLLPEKQDLAL